MVIDKIYVLYGSHFLLSREVTLSCVKTPRKINSPSTLLIALCLSTSISFSTFSPGSQCGILSVWLIHQYWAGRQVDQIWKNTMCVRDTSRSDCWTLTLKIKFVARFLPFFGARDCPSQLYSLDALNTWNMIHLKRQKMCGTHVRISWMWGNFKGHLDQADLANNKKHLDQAEGNEEQREVDNLRCRPRIWSFGGSL